MEIKAVFRVVGLLGILFLAGACTSPPRSPQEQVIGDPARFDRQRYPDKDSLAREKEAAERARKEDMLKR